MKKVNYVKMLYYLIIILLGTFTLGFSRQGKVFALQVLVKAKQAHSNTILNKEGTKAYWCHNGIWFSKMVDGKWIIPKLVLFSKKKN